jgi:3-isopropylmalate dehydratase small subunit
VLADIDPQWATQVAAGDVVCVEELHVGDGGSGALLALAQTGVAAIIAHRYADGIEHATLAAGIVPVSLDAPAFIHTGDRVRVDLEAAKIVNLSSGDRAGIRNLDEPRRAAIRAMLRACHG